MKFCKTAQTTWAQLSEHLSPLISDAEQNHALGYFCCFIAGFVLCVWSENKFLHRVLFCFLSVFLPWLPSRFPVRSCYNQRNTLFPQAQQNHFKMKCPSFQSYIHTHASVSGRRPPLGRVMVVSCSFCFLILDLMSLCVMFKVWDRYFPELVLACCCLFR